MDKKLEGVRVALLEARRSSELAELVRRSGGEPYCVPAVREAALECTDQVIELINALTAGSIQVVIFLTGVGASAVFREAENLGRLPELLEVLNSVVTVCRGPKPVAVLKKTGVRISLVAPEPNTSVELLQVMADLDLKGKTVALMHYGERNAFLAEALQARGAKLLELCLYEWLLPEDIQPLKDLVEEVVAGKLDAVAFTSQVQIRHLFQMAQEKGLAGELGRALNDRTIVASVGPTCTGVLQGFGVEPHVIPEHPKMGHLVLALGQYVDATRPSSDS